MCVRRREQAVGALKMVVGGESIVSALVMDVLSKQSWNGCEAIVNEMRQRRLEK